MLLCKQEAIIQRTFDIAESIIGAIVLNARKSLKMRGKKGTKLYRLLTFLGGKNDNDLAIAQIVATHQGAKGSTKGATGNYEVPSSYSALQASNDTKKHFVQS